tara:strand:- start:235 stop:426 length:192 start_codon:yes stop_codon:yes gene_type:complete
LVVAEEVEVLSVVVEVPVQLKLDLFPLDQEHTQLLLVLVVLAALVRLKELMALTAPLPILVEP